MNFTNYILFLFVDFAPNCWQILQWLLLSLLPFSTLDSDILWAIKNYWNAHRSQSMSTTCVNIYAYMYVCAFIRVSKGFTVARVAFLLSARVGNWKFDWCVIVKMLHSALWITRRYTRMWSCNKLYNKYTKLLCVYALGKEFEIELKNKQEHLSLWVKNSIPL